MNDYTLKDACVLFRASQIIHDGVVYKVLEAWKAMYEPPKVRLWSDRFKPHVPVLTAVKEQQLFAGAEGDV